MYLRINLPGMVLSILLFFIRLDTHLTLTVDSTRTLNSLPCALFHFIHTHFRVYIIPIKCARNVMLYAEVHI